MRPGRPSRTLRRRTVPVPPVRRRPAARSSAVPAALVSRGGRLTGGSGEAPCGVPRPLLDGTLPLRDRRRGAGSVCLFQAVERGRSSGSAGGRGGRRGHRGRRASSGRGRRARTGGSRRPGPAPLRGTWRLVMRSSEVMLLVLRGVSRAGRGRSMGSVVHVAASRPTSGWVAAHAAAAQQHVARGMPAGCTSTPAGGRRAQRARRGSLGPVRSLWTRVRAVQGDDADSGWRRPST